MVPQLLANSARMCHFFLHLLSKSERQILLPLKVLVVVLSPVLPGFGIAFTCSCFLCTAPVWETSLKYCLMREAGLCRTLYEVFYEAVEFRICFFQNVCGFYLAQFCSSF